MPSSLMNEDACRASIYPDGGSAGRSRLLAPTSKAVPKARTGNLRLHETARLRPAAPPGSRLPAAGEIGLLGIDRCLAARTRRESMRPDRGHHTQGIRRIGTIGHEGVTRQAWSG